MAAESPLRRGMIYGIILFLWTLATIQIYPAFVRLSMFPNIVTVGGVRTGEMNVISKYLHDTAPGWDQPIGVSVMRLVNVLGNGAGNIRNDIVVSKSDGTFEVIVIRQYGNIGQPKRYRMRIEADRVELLEALYIIN
ncbi:MAG: hypothetical protein NTV46_19170 [Verrucomicrobia bacterium]|nr:hypothetical protein [Verrucomicrobiota bacterium]